MTMVDCSGIKGVVECTEDSPRRRIWLRIPELGDQVAFRTTQIVWRPTDVSLAWCWTVIVVGDTDEQSRRVVVEAHSVDGDARFRHVRWWEIPRSVGRRLCRGAHRETTVRAVVEELLGDLVLSRELAGDGFVLEEPNADNSIPEGSESDGEPDYDSFVENCDPIALDWAKAVELDFNRTQPALVDAASRALAQNRLVARNCPMTGVLMVDHGDMEAPYTECGAVVRFAARTVMWGARTWHLILEVHIRGESAGSSSYSLLDGLVRNSLEDSTTSLSFGLFLATNCPVTEALRRPNPGIELRLPRIDLDRRLIQRVDVRPVHLRHPRWFSVAAVDAAPLWVVLDGESPLVGPIAAWRMANGGFEEVEISSLATTAEARGGSQVLVVDPMQGEPPESNRQWSVFIFGDPDASDAAEEEVRRRHGVGVFPAPTVVKVEQDASVRIVHLETPPLD